MSEKKAADQGQQNEGQQPAAQKQQTQGQPNGNKLLTTSKSYSAEREIVLFSRIKLGAFGNNYGSVYISYRGTEVSVSI